MADQSSGVSTTPCAGRPAQSSFSPESRYERSSSSAAATTRLVPGSVQVSHAALIGNPADETLDDEKDITRPCCASRGQRVILVEHLLVFGAGWFSLRGHGFKGPYFGASIAASSCGANRTISASRS